VRGDGGEEKRGGEQGDSGVHSLILWVFGCGWGWLGMAKRMRARPHVEDDATGRFPSRYICSGVEEGRSVVARVALHSGLRQRGAHTCAKGERMNGAPGEVWR
jgi:hypothetical protein